MLDKCLSINSNESRNLQIFFLAFSSKTDLPLYCTRHMHKAWLGISHSTLQAPEMDLCTVYCAGLAWRSDIINLQEPMLCFLFDSHSYSSFFSWKWTFFCVGVKDGWAAADTVTAAPRSHSGRLHSQGAERTGEDYNHSHFLRYICRLPAAQTQDALITIDESLNSWKLQDLHWLLSDDFSELSMRASQTWAT